MSRPLRRLDRAVRPVAPLFPRARVAADPVEPGELVEDEPDQRRALLAQKKRLLRQMQHFAFAQTCFRDALLSYFGETRIASRRPMRAEEFLRGTSVRPGFMLG